MTTIKNTNLKRSKILLTGGAGFLGKHVFEELVSRGVSKKNITVPLIEKYDLRKRGVCEKLTRKADMVIHLAGNVGGIGKNIEIPGTLFYDNAVMGMELIEAARKNNVKKFVCIGTICAYPKITPIPFKEKDLWKGYPEETNAPYGIAKKALLVQLQAYQKQYDFNGIYLLPVNLYGPGDNFNPKSSHVIPALIKKVHDAQKNNDKEVIVWGTGKASREFLFVKDAAKAIVDAAEKYNKAEPINIGTNHEITIKELINLISKLMGYKGKIKWDKSKPDGQPRRKLSTVKAKKEFGFVAQTSFKKGLKETIEWYKSTHE